MIICKVFNDDGSVAGIRVDEACTTEFIAAELFEMETPWLQFRDVSEGPDGVTGSFRITALNGEWTYRLLRRLDWMPQVFEAELALGEAKPCPAMTSTHGLRHQH